MVPIPVTTILRDAAAALERRNHRDAERLAADAAAKEPQNARAHLLHGYALHGQGKFQTSAIALQQAVTLGGAVTLPVKHHHGGFPDDSLCEGTLTISRAELQFRSDFEANHGFVVPFDRVYAIKNEPQKGARVNVNVGLPKRRGTGEDKKDFNFQSVEAQVVSQGSIKVVRCNGCDDRMNVVFSLLSHARSLR